MDTWNIRSIEVQPHHPQVICSTDEGRAIVIQLPAGEMLQEHEVHEAGWLLVMDGQIELVMPDGQETAGEAGFFAHFAPQERREIRATSDARLLLVLTPWPGEGHPSQQNGQATSESKGTPGPLPA